MGLELRVLGAGDESVLDRVADGVFDMRVDAAKAAEYVANENFHIVVALDGELVVAMVTAVDYVHPDKPRALWINEVGVADSHLRQGIGKQVLARMLEFGRELGCTQAWLGTDVDNAPARRLYESMGGKVVSETYVEYEWDLDSDG